MSTTSISKCNQRLRKLQGLQLKISAIRKVLTFVTSTWFNSQFSASLVLSNQSRPVPLTGGPVPPVLEEGFQAWPSHLPGAGCSTAALAAAQMPRRSCQPPFFPSIDQTAAWAVHKPRKKKKKKNSCLVAFCQAAIACVLQGTVGEWKVSEVCSLNHTCL